MTRRQSENLRLIRGEHRVEEKKTKAVVYPEAKSRDKITLCDAKLKNTKYE